MSFQCFLPSHESKRMTLYWMHRDLSTPGTSSSASREKVCATDIPLRHIWHGSISGESRMSSISEKTLSARIKWARCRSCEGVCLLLSKGRGSTTAGAAVTVSAENRLQKVTRPRRRHKKMGDLLPLMACCSGGIVRGGGAMVGVGE